ncbi:unnamed protein product, partial [Effrenium voratum]
AAAGGNGYVDLPFATAQLQDGRRVSLMLWRLMRNYLKISGYIRAEECWCLRGVEPNHNKSVDAHEGEEVKFEPGARCGAKSEPDLESAEPILDIRLPGPWPTAAASSLATLGVSP